MRQRLEIINNEDEDVLCQFSQLSQVEIHSLKFLRRDETRKADKGGVFLPISAMLAQGKLQCP